MASQKLENISNVKSVNERSTYNFIDKDKLLLNQNCFTNIVYKARLTSTNPSYGEEIYFSTSKAIFKLRYSKAQFT